MPGVDADTTLPPDGLQQAQGEFLPGIFRVRAEVFLVPPRAIGSDDMIGPLKRNDLVGSRMRILWNWGHARFELNVVNRIPDRGDRPPQPWLDPLNVVLDPPLDGREPESGGNLIHGPDPQSD